ncbi:Ig-like domain-containing protein [Actinobaculum sp. 313]|uniref:Ig-like domain-containing protein n=1 Tax=Actinobaculum sp. 313 TaxID=2495645 RepID=UPI000F743570|nr:Ig-like domain-containing protein [Actinobaculum sp. 313]
MTTARKSSGSGRTYGSRSRRWLGRSGALLTAMVTALAGLLLIGPAAQAKEIDVITGVTVKNIPHPSGPSRQWDETRVEFTIDTTGSGARAGDTFTLKLPDLLTTRATSFTMHASDGTTPVAECTAPNGVGQTLTCTLTDYVTTHPNMTGEGWLWSQLNSTSTARTFDFVKAGGTITVEIPGTDGVIGPEDRTVPTEALKGGWVRAEDPALFYWYIRIPASAYQGTNTITINDTFGTNGLKYHLADGANYRPYLQVWSTQEDYSKQVSAVRVNPGESIGSGTFNFNPTGNGFTATIPNDNPNAIYEVRYFVYLDNPASAKIGDKLTNTATVSGATVDRTLTISTSGDGFLDGPGLGGISVKKEALTGSGAEYVATDASFTVKATYVVNGSKETKELHLAAGGEAQELHGLPVGTEVTLSEIVPDDGDLVWGKPVFRSSADNVSISEDGTTATVTVGDQTTTAVSVTNQVTAPTPSIDLVKKDSDGNDADTAEEAVDLTAKNGATGLVFTIKNDGTEALVGVEVTDSITQGKGKVENIVCTFPDGSTGTTWDGPFEVDASFSCTADLSGVTTDEIHGDIAKVTAKGRTTGIPVEAKNPYHASVTKSPASTGTPSATPTPKKTLPRTGSDVTGLAAVAISAMLLGGSAVVVARRRKLAN